VSVRSYLERAWLPYYLIPLLLVGAVAYIDVIGWHMFKAVENPSATYLAMESLYMSLFHGLVYLAILGPALVVYYYQGLGAGLGYLSWALAVLYSGVWDLLYYLFRDRGLPESMSHLSGKPPGVVAGLIGSDMVSTELIVLNAVLFLGVGLGLAYSFRRGRLGELVPDY